MVLLELKVVRTSLVKSSWVSALDFPKITCQSNAVGGTVMSVFFVMKLFFFVYVGYAYHSAPLLLIQLYFLARKELLGPVFGNLFS